MRETSNSKPNSNSTSRDAISPDVGKTKGQPTRSDTMTTKQQAQRKLTAAEKATTLILEGKTGAVDVLANDTVNGYGILRDPSSTRLKLEKARVLITAAIAMLAATDWPTDSDYDHF